MSLKPNEKFVTDCLINYFGIENSNAWEGEKNRPPDIYIKIKGEIVAVEITRLLPPSFDPKGNVQNRTTQDSLGCDICDELNLEMKDYIPTNVDITLCLYMPVKDVKKYKKELKKYVSDTIEGIKTDKIKIGYETEFTISGSKVKLSVIPRRKNSHKRITGRIFNNNSCPAMPQNVKVEAMLEERILDKVKKCSKIQHNGSLWLALFYDDWFASHDDYFQALKNISIQHDFKKIFVVSNKGIVNQIAGNVEKRTFVSRIRSLWNYVCLLFFK